jgi:glycosyltransferase involved in cell wall biosynthesis/SAM-dependent methyltransferase
MKNLIILGSGRSGTSLCAGLFAEAGYSFGGVPYPARESNPKGFFETHAVNGVNEELLASILPRHPRYAAGQRWLCEVPPGALPEASAELDRRMARLTARAPWCFKDPRFVHTLPAWRPHTEGALHLCVFRDPAITAESIVRECRREPYLADVSMSFERALSAWTSMYRPVLERHRHAGEWQFVHYEQLFTGEGLERLARSSGSPVSVAFPDARLARTQSDRNVTAAAAEIYAELCSLAGHTGTARAIVPVAKPERARATRANPVAPELSVILCTYNRRAILERSLASFARQDAPHGSFELVVVNDGSTDGTREALDAIALPIPTTVIHRDNGGLAAARNSGIEKARGKLLLFVNDDTIAFPSLVTEHLAAHAAHGDQPVSVLGTFEQPLSALDNALMRTLEVTDFVFRYSDMEAGKRYDYNRYWTCNVSSPAAAVRAAGGFDESFRQYGAEDIDLGFRLAEAGIDVVFHPDARARHDHVLDFEALKRRQRICASSFVRLFAKHPECLDNPDWAWLEARRLADLEQAVDAGRARVPALEEAARTLATIDLGALDGREAGAGDVVSVSLQHLARLLRELNAIWWQQGFADGLREFGFDSFDAIRRPARGADVEVVSEPLTVEGLDRIRSDACAGETSLSTIELIRRIARSSDGAAGSSSLRADAWNDLAVLRFTSGDYDGSLACLAEVLRIDSSHALAAANRRDIEAARDRRKPRWGEGPDAKALPTSLNPWVAEALTFAQERGVLAERDVLEIGGSVPESAARSTGARKWHCGYLEAQEVRGEFYERRALDCRALPYADASFDTVFSSAAFEHIRDLDRALSELRRVLRPGGVIVTNFAPIWSCAVGHHLWESDARGERIMFLDGIVPLWGHLALTERELSCYLRVVLGEEAAARAVHYIYHHPCINRVFEGEFRTLFRAAGFDDSGLLHQPPWAADHVPTAHMRAELTRLHPRGGEFATPGFRGVLSCAVEPPRAPLPSKRSREIGAIA